MLSAVFPFVLGALTTGGALLYFLFAWNPRPLLAAQLAKKRRAAHPTSFHLSRAPNAWEERARAAMRAAPSHAPESCDWINALSGYVFSFLSDQINAAAADGRLEAAINEKLNSKPLPEVFCAPLIVSHLSVGSSLPLLQRVEVTNSDPAAPLEFSASVSYHGSAFVVVGTSVCAPGVPFIQLPVELALKNLTIDATARFTLDLSRLPRVRARISLAPDVHIGLELRTQLGHQLVLQDLEVLQAAAQLVVQKVVREELVEPHFKEVEFDLWEKKEEAAAPAGSSNRNTHSSASKQV